MKEDNTNNPGYKKFEFPKIVYDFYATMMEKTSISNRSANAQFLTQLLHHYAKESVINGVNKKGGLEEFYKCVAALKFEKLLAENDESVNNIKTQKEYDDKLEKMRLEVKSDFEKDLASTSRSGWSKDENKHIEGKAIISLVYDAMKEEIGKTKVLGVGKKNGGKLKTILANTRRIFQKMLVPTAFYPMLKIAFSKKATTKDISKITPVQDGYGSMNPAREFSSLGYIHGAARDTMRRVLDNEKNSKQESFLGSTRFSSTVKKSRKHNANNGVSK